MATAAITGTTGTAALLCGGTGAGIGWVLGGRDSRVRAAGGVDIIDACGGGLGAGSGFGTPAGSIDRCLGR